MKKISTFRLCILLMAGFFMVCCGASKSGGGNKSASDEQVNANYKKVCKWVDDKAFTIISDWANPLNANQVNFYGNRYNLNNLLPPGSGGGRINLIGNSNFLTIYNDSVSGYLPYYGVVQVVKNYGGTNGGIEFDGIPENYEVSKNDDKKEVKIGFNIKDQSETFKINITLYANYNSTINISSAYRYSISYNGKVKKREDKK